MRFLKEGLALVLANPPFRLLLGLDCDPRMTATAIIVEQSLKQIRSRDMTACQILILLELSQSTRPKRIGEITAAVNESRQYVYQSIRIMGGREVKIDRPKRNMTLVSITKAGKATLKEVLGDG